MTSALRVLIVGLGSIGRRHLRILRNLVPDARIAAWRRPESAREGNELVDVVVRSLHEALQFDPGAAILAGPASQRLAVGLPLAEQGIHLLAEKPLAASLEGVQELLDTCRRSEVVLQVGYNLRFHAPAQTMRDAIHDGAIGRPLFLRAEVGQHLGDWRPGVDPAATVSAQADLGGGALLELSHEIDLARWLLGDLSVVAARTHRLGDLAVDVEDYAEVWAESSEGVQVSLAMDMIRRPPHRTCRIVGVAGTLVADLLSGEVRLGRETGSWNFLAAPGSAMLSSSYGAQLEHFLACVDGRATPRVSGEDAARTLALALEARARALTRGQST